ncbi:MAG: hypothetical protein ACLP0A_17280 [Verrucomicrobiia bacterium]
MNDNEVSGSIFVTATKNWWGRWKFEVANAPGMYAFGKAATGEDVSTIPVGGSKCLADDTANGFILMWLYDTPEQRDGILRRFPLTQAKAQCIKNSIAPLLEGRQQICTCDEYVGNN